jgi:hypothetical protein
LTYGHVTAPLHRVLSLAAVLAAIAAIAAMVAATWALSVAADQIAIRRRRPAAAAAPSPSL